MRKLAFLIFILFTGTVHSQEAFTSYYTQSFPTIFTSEIQEINRKIIFEPETITIETEVKGGKEIEVLNIESHNFENDLLTFVCRSRNSKKIMVAIPEQDKVEIIDYYYHSPKTKEEIQLRFHVEHQE